MGLFKKNPAEKRLKELTGGIFLSAEFKDRLKRAGLSAADGFPIQNRLKEDIKSGKVTEDGIDVRIDYLIDQRKKEIEDKKSNSPSPKKGLIAIEDDGSSKVHVISSDSLESKARSDKVKEIKFLINQEHNVEKCPKCGATVLKLDRFCYNCGVNIFLSGSHGSDKADSSLKSKDISLQSSNESEDGFMGEAFKEAEKSADEILNGDSGEEVLKAEESVKAEEEPLTAALEPLFEPPKEKEKPTEDNSTLDELSELEKLYSKKVSSKYSPKFKFAYVLYLNEIKKKPSKELPEDKYLQLYDTRVSKLKKQALEDNYIEYGNPLIAAESATVKEIKDVLKEHDLKVSGKKEDLIERLGQSLSEEDLRKAFPKKVLSISDKGNEFIEKNRYIFYYDKTTPLRTHMEVDEYDSIFEDADDLSDENIYALLIDHLIKREDDFIMNKKWSPYRYNFMILARVYKDSGDEYKVLDCDFKLFIAGINNFSDYTNKSEPFNGYVGKTYSNELIDLMHSLSLTIDELKDRFGQSYDELRYPELKISKEESLLYLLKLFSGEDSEDITSEIRSKYPAPMF